MQIWVHMVKAGKDSLPRQDAPETIFASDGKIQPAVFSINHVTQLTTSQYLSF